MEHDITNVAAAEHDRATVTTEGSATPTAVLEGHAPRPVSYVSVPPNMWALARAFATVLAETLPPPIRTITRAVDRLGPECARAVLGQALTIEAQGGLTLPNGHRRTLGGVFFHLVRTSDAISREDKDYIFPRHGGRPLRTGGNGAPASATPAPTAFAPATWTDDIYRALAQQLQHDTSGRATTVKITVIGRPGTAVEQGQAVVLALTSEKVPDLPKGLPEPPVGTRYTVFVARKPWTKVAEALAADPEDTAIIEGYAALDPRIEGIAVYATNATTKRLQAAKRVTTATVTP
jgi:hypothetical protein